ncbi:TlpA disulfide reductase family protein [Butyricimonas hominis]|uniref:AhpC/TSA family protein n=1 Tax=Butyricimonas hominis TaxID=2763032 RepID=A0ABR7D1L0_9BACT|nr:TlpA disulfide reductase family protein [Butyricimonas hominis]MBC5621400.1 AhpC/TSA family protein [Butyricimonas hominis]
MRKISLLIGLAILSTFACKAQQGYQISGKVSGMTDGTLLLIANEWEKPDTLGSVTVKNGVFVFTGKVNAPVAAYLAPSDGNGMIPLILENANFMVNVSDRGAMIQGGKQQELLTRFTRISQAFLAEQAKVAAEAQQPGANVQALQDRVNKAYEASVNATIELIKANPDEYATAHVIALGISGETEEGLRSKYDLLGEAARATIPGKRIAAALEQYEKLAIGEVAPNFTTEKPDGNTFSLYDLPGKLKLVYFWVSTNPLCRQDNTDLVKLYLQYRPLGLEIVSISLDENRGDWRNAVGQDGMVWINGSDLQGFASPNARLYMVHELPATFLVDAENRIVAKGLRGDVLRDTVAKLLKKSKKK